jgi:hypothetical protein
MSDEPRPPYADAWAELTGTEWKMTDGVSTLINLQALPRNKHPRWRLVDPAMVEYWQPPHNIVDLRWQRPHAPKGPRHRFDLRAAYLAAAAQVELPYRQLRLSGPHACGVGYYRVAITRAQTDQLWLPRPDRQGCIWVTHDELQAVRLGAHEIIDTCVAEDSGRILRTWAEKWRDCILRTYGVPDRGPLRSALKNGYAQAFGLMGAKTQGVYRPDWRHLIVGYVRQAMRRRALNVRTALGVDPVRIDVDSIWYAQDEIKTGDWAVLTAALGVGDRIGQMRYEGTEP